MELLSLSRKILILDDNRIDRETWRRFLNQSAPAASYQFIEHDSLTGALALVEAEQPDCILLDYHLHDGTGIEFLQALEAPSGILNHTVVMLTGTGSESIAVEAMKIGAQDYLVKDRLSPEVLHRTVQAAIYKANSQRLIEKQRVDMERLFREAQEANARKDHFLATLSHELRTPLTPVLASVALLEEAADDPDYVREIASIIRRNIELEARLIDDMLDLTRISNGKLEVDLLPVDITRILLSALETCQADLVRQEHRVVEDFQAVNPMIRGDEARLQQVFWNLLKNAAKFTPPQGTITVSTLNTPDGWLEIRVRDTGIGIPPSELENIFLSFEQGSGANTGKRFGGLGLGLAICRALVEAHGGTIRAESGSDRLGADFIVRLESTREETPLPPPKESNSQANVTRTRKFGTVLVVEDHADTLAFVLRIIQRMGHQVLSASNAAEAIDIYQNQNQGQAVDCIVSDIGLPDRTGIELMRDLQTIRPVPAIALSGYGMEEDVTRSKEAGFTSHLVKPITGTKLVAAVDAVFTKGK